MALYSAFIFVNNIKLVSAGIWMPLGRVNQAIVDRVWLYIKWWKHASILTNNVPLILKIYVPHTTNNPLIGLNRGLTLRSLSIFFNRQELVLSIKLIVFYFPTNTVPVSYKTTGNY